MSQRRTAAETKQIIFDAASQILRRDGLSSLTIESVAQEAGLSKGGLLYHFPTKAALIDAIFEFHNDIFERRLQELAAAEGTGQGAWLRAYARASVEQITDPASARLYASLFAAEEKYMTAHKLMRDKYINWQTQVDNCGLDPNWAMLVRLTVDGLWFSEMHQYAPPNPDQRAELIKLIFHLTENPIILAD